MTHCKWLKISALVGAALLSVGLSSCGGDPRADDRRLGDDENQPRKDAGPGPGIVGDDDDDGRPSGKTDEQVCEGRGADCGYIADGEGGTARCGECPSGEACGVVTRNVCTEVSEAALCKPATKEEACEGKECGAEGDGCGGVYDCGDCKSGESCGLVTPFQCGVIPTASQCDAQLGTCAEQGFECGKAGNGCGGLIDCDAETGGCKGEEYCGGAGPQKCGVAACTPIAAAAACAGKCGKVSNGCGQEVNGGVVDCDTASPCGPGLVCGASGVPNVCGDPSDPCIPKTAQQACGAAECGAASDGCGGSVVCGSCGSSETCRVGVCEAACKPLTQQVACAGKACGKTSDGCGGVHDCGGCPMGEACGLEQAFTCSPLPDGNCTPRSPAVACAGRECGTTYDGCGTAVQNRIDCAVVNGGCSGDEFCGILTPFQCDSPVPPDCTAAASCAELGWECGIAFDECGNQFDCSTEGRTCNPDTETCIGGVSAPARCENPFETGGACDVCDGIPDCSAQPQRTRLTGRVVTAGRNDNDLNNQVGVPNAFVYILRNNNPAELPAIPSGIPTGGTSCDRCDDQELGPVLASATSDALGNYVLDGDIPVGQEFVLVVKIGKWRRAVQMTLPSNAACATTVVQKANSRLPRTMVDGLAVNIPRVAITTGEVDAMECVLYKMGVADSQFAAGQAGNVGRLHLYGNDGATISGGDSNPAEDALHADLTRMMTYDMLVFDCQGAGFPDHDTSDSRVKEYVNRGGRMFASHLSYTWICDNGVGLNYTPADPLATGLAASAVFPGCATAAGTGVQDPGKGIVSVGRPRANATKIQKFADWLVTEGAATFTLGRYEMSIAQPRNLATSVGASSEEFVYLNEDQSVQQYSFNTPYGAPQNAICGRVAYSGFHVAPSGGAANYNNKDFPAHCTDLAANNGVLTQQEKVLLYMLFDLGACVSEEPPLLECTKVSCTGLCGTVPDGCGGEMECPCECTPTTCEAEGAQCGTIANGCGGDVVCGPCPVGAACNTQNNLCEPACTPLSVGEACGAGSCGFASDGCGDVVECPECPPPLSCIDGACSEGECTPKDCPANLECGFVADGCSGVAACGDCTEPEFCGAAGVPNMCGQPMCQPLSCGAQNAECGFVGDGCGSAVDCGPCPAGQVCGGALPNQCVGCAPLSCDDVGAECGKIGNGCGATVDCGPCPGNQVCGAREPNQCDDGPKCDPRTCADVGAECGEIGDGCGGSVDCGPCDGNQICGIESPFKCGDPPTCTPKTCESENAQCGALSDGCDGLLECGKCPSGFVCGLKQANRCARAGVK